MSRFSGPNLQYLGPLRTYPQRHIYQSNYKENKEGKVGENEWLKLFGSRSILAEVNSFLGKDFLNTQHQIGVKEFRYDKLSFSASGSHADAATSNELTHQEPEVIRELKVYKTGTTTELSNRDIGLGISQVLPVLVTLVSGYRKLVAIEQPELHLHPAMQANLADVFIGSTIMEDRTKRMENTLIVETHSEHLILRILRRIRQTTEGNRPKHLPAIYPSDVAILYVQPEPEGARVIQIPVNKNGEFEEPWPGGFFPERLEEYLD